MALHLVSFGNRSTRRSVSFFENACAIRDCAVAAGFDHAHAWDASIYAETEFESRNQSLLKEKRGAGYWVWKPWIIRRALEKIRNDDVLLYSDAGKLPLTTGDLSIRPVFQSDITELAMDFQ